MANTLWISEFDAPSLNYRAPQMPGTDQPKIAYSTATLSAAFGATTKFIRVVSDSSCSIKVGDGTVVATADDFFLPANVVEYLGVLPGQFLSVITNT